MRTAKYLVLDLGSTDFWYTFRYKSSSGFIAEFKGCGFWAAVYVFVVGVVGRSPFIKSPKISALAVQYF
jgi:hypothetical protein